MRNIAITSLLLTFNTVFATETLQCRDENNNPVDWFYIVKFPHLSYVQQPSMRAGKGYMFITDNGLNDGWRISNKNIDSQDTLIANTLGFFRKKDKDDLLWLVYNDQGDIECERCGHTKGFIAGGILGGFWLIHSVPHYLQDEYPNTGFRYGQSALCISLNQTYLNNIGDLLKYNQPNFQKWNLNDKLKEFYPKLVAATKKFPMGAPYNLQLLIASKGGTEFQAFAKSRDFHADIYQWIADSLKVDVYTETWLNEPRVLPSSCDTKYRVINILFMVYQKLNISYSSHKDHSKLAIAALNSKPWVCVGDINRADSQEHRGGGTICLKNSQLWKLYYNLVNGTEGCPTNDIIQTHSSEFNELLLKFR